MREEPVRVAFINSVSGGWDEAIEQCSTVEQLIDQIEAGTFEFSFGSER